MATDKPTTRRLPPAAHKKASTQAPAPARPRSQKRLIWMLGALGVVGLVYLCLPKSWFEIPPDTPPAAPGTAPLAQPLSPLVSPAIASPGPAPLPPAGAALEDLRAAAGRNALDYLAHSRYGMALAAAGQREEALEEFLTAARLAPEAPGVRQNLGVYYLNSGQLDKAEDAFGRELEISPGDGRAHYYLGLIHQKRNQPAQAVAQFRLAVALAPDLPDPYLSLAIQLTKQQSAEQTRELIEKYIQLTGNKGLGDYVMSGVYKTKHEYADAARYAEMTVQEEPNNYGYWHNLGQIYSYARRMEDADHALKHALTLTNSPKLVLIELGINSQKAGKHQEALDWFQKALAADPKDGLIHQFLARTYQRLGDHPAAQREEAAFREWNREDIRQRHTVKSDAK